MNDSSFWRYTICIVCFFLCKLAVWISDHIRKYGSSRLLFASQQSSHRSKTLSKLHIKLWELDGKMGDLRFESLSRRFLGLPFSKFKVFIQVQLFKVPFLISKISLKSILTLSCVPAIIGCVIQVFSRLFTRFGE